MTLKLHRPDERGVVTSYPEEKAGDWRTTLRSPRWNAAALKNPEMNPTSRPASVLYWLVLGAITFGILMLGYGSGFWR
ncbi:MAG: hypothetical protein WCP38_00030 [Chloroflexota bacterium]|jgi:hypothetical protein